MPGTVDYDTFTNLNETPITDLVKASRKPVVNPVREKSHKYAPLKRTKDKKQKDEEDAWKKLNLEAAKERAWAGELPFDGGASISAAKGKVETKVPKSTSTSSKSKAAPSKGKKKVEIVSDDDDIIIESDEEEDEHESEEASLADADSDVEIMVRFHAPVHRFSVVPRLIRSSSTFPGR